MGGEVEGLEGRDLEAPLLPAVGVLLRDPSSSVLEVIGRG